MKRNSYYVSKALRWLFGILSIWEPIEEFTLEIDVTLTDDDGHWFRDIDLSTDREHGESTSSNFNLQTRNYADAVHDWVNGVYYSAPPWNVTAPVHGALSLESKPPEMVVRVVTKLIVGQFMGVILFPIGLPWVLACLSNLDSVLTITGQITDAVRNLNL